MTEQHRERLGTTEAGGYVVVDLALTHSGATTPQATIHHGEVLNPLRVSLTGEHYERGDRRHNPSQSGQIVASLAEVTTPAPGWTLEEIAELATLWSRWHINDMRAACAHMPTDAHVRWAARETVTCTEGSGYTYGSAWLTEPVPPHVYDRLRHLMRSRTADLYAARGYDGAGHRV